ncbi:putative transcription factor & chromatin remodeling CW-Zn family [Rosa chinensis]|uniref:Putative transcription factor & chromatin remodeling CW-Zn family n=1 Tax=Rosa chinensis TaxID=74649 RepID=A0A2P6QS74_ROSCH|nr:methyl-CpG-binding domain-containing protein 2 isoform X1 [Rosa chinensis]XP_024196831.1 methyl-CpG-binding domain-containing protein 2 isoform X1 [Rosa chinensis]PRQ37018.1 putative transcription factor & chromatin remodeling CW-Zn family [Rosa chinensis]
MESTTPSPCKITLKLRRDDEQEQEPKTNDDKPAQSPSSSSVSSPPSSPSSSDEILQSHLQSQELVLYDPAVAANAGGDANRAATVNRIPNLNKSISPVSVSNSQGPRVLPSVGAFTVQCANCFKWRLIPTKEQYEQIREHILERPFYCETAKEWRPSISCDDPADITQDGSRLWAIDRPNIAQPPPGWQRLLRIRGEGSTKFADVYYQAPSGKRLRSMVEVQKYLIEHPEYMVDGLSMAQFSFQIPRPLQENYVRKRPAAPRLTAAAHASRTLEPTEANPIAWAGPDDTELQLGSPYLEAHVFDPVGRPTKKRAKTRTPSRVYNSNLNISTESS